MKNQTSEVPDGQSVILGPYLKRAVERVQTPDGLQDFLAELSIFAGTVFSSCDDELFRSVIAKSQREAGKGSDTESRAVRATCHWAEMVRKDLLEIAAGRTIDTGGM